MDKIEGDGDPITGAEILDHAERVEGVSEVEQVAARATVERSELSQPADGMLQRRSIRPA